MKYKAEEFEPVEEMSAVEAVKLLGEICKKTARCPNCPIKAINETMSCHEIERNYPIEVVATIKKWKADYEKKPIEMESVSIVRVIEDTGDIKKCVYEEELAERENPMDAKERVLKEYCQKHTGKFFTVFESICRVKE